MADDPPPFSPAAYFARDYPEARERFREAAGAAFEAVGGSSFVGLADPAGGAECLTTDAIRLGDPGAPALLVLSGGLHGVEGFFGSAVERQVLETLRARRADGLPPGVAMLLIHALNPWGFAHVRRADENNVDLNRNFLLPGEPYAGSPRAYAELDAVLNPPRPPSRFDPFAFSAGRAILRYGKPALKQAIAGGQYDFPGGLFYGGAGPSRTLKLLRDHLPRWVGPASRVLHLDFHTGLGKWAACKLLADYPLGDIRREWLESNFGTGAIEESDAAGVAYATRGSLGRWCQSLFPGGRYTYLCAEFGTYGPLTMLSCLRRENQAHHWGEPGSPLYQQAKRRLLEAFCPDAPEWRRKTISLATSLVRRAAAALVSDR